ncbi:hypothetical protein C8R43DRAFT_875402 [Mycena crocata]|nr:hypothetical protein C8R43DRAFT_875402 [Mycena crocata]
MRQWPAELRNAHTAFLVGQRWGEEWADCVNRFLDFEAGCGYVEKGPRIGGGKDRPHEVWEWVKGGRRWHDFPVLDSKKIGGIGQVGTFVDTWWLWWRSIQPPERKWVNGGLTCPPGMKWGRMATLCGPNGYMQVMLSLLWWGSAVAGKQNEGDWSSAVGQVDFALGEILASGELR